VAHGEVPCGIQRQCNPCRICCNCVIGRGILKSTGCTPGRVDEGGNAGEGLGSGCGHAATVLSGGVVAAAGAGSAGAASAKSPIKIGLVCSCTGPLSGSVVDVPPAYKAWVDSVNARGGINGHKVNLITKDDASNPTTSVAIVQGFVTADHVVAIVDATTNDAAWANYVEQHKVPVVGMDTSTAPYYTNPDFYPEGQTEDSLFSGIIQAVKQAGGPGTKFALVYCAEAVQCQEGVAPLQAAAKGIGESVVASLEVSASAPSYTAQCLAAKQAGATVIFTADAQSVDEKIIQDCYAQGYKPKVVIDGEVLLPSFKATAGINQATYFTVPNFPFFVNTPAIKTMNTAFDKYAPGLRKDVNYGEFSMEAWTAGVLFETAALAGHLGANGKTPAAAAVTNGLNSLNGETLGGLVPPLHFVAGQPHPIDCWYWAVLKNGKYSTPLGLKPACATKS
jgi:branched-chain amino acid transport system substrate-binding protein